MTDEEENAGKATVSTETRELLKAYAKLHDAYGDFTQAWYNMTGRECTDTLGVKFGELKDVEIKIISEAISMKMDDTRFMEI